MNILLLRASWCALLLAAAADVCRAVSPEQSFQERGWEQLSDKDVSDWGRAAIGIDPKHWRHGETEHFVIHFFRNGDKIARLSEDRYAKIKVFFGNRADRLGRQKSHVFAFHEPKDWEQFKQLAGLQWIAGVTRGNEFFFISATETGRFDSKAKVQAHEMTHLIFNRFFTGRLPLWLNEGIAEYFGMKETTGPTEFRQAVGWSMAPRANLDTVFDAESYPPNVDAFYAEAASLIDFLTRTSQQEALLPKFVDAMITEQNLAKAVKVYGFDSIDQFKARYEDYRKSNFERFRRKD